VVVEQGPVRVPELDVRALEQLGVWLASLERFPFVERRLSVVELLKFPGIERPKQESERLESDGKRALEEAVDLAIQGVLASRATEGGRIKEKLQGMVSELRSTARMLSDLVPELSQQMALDLRERLTTCFREGQTPPECVLEETVAAVARLDVREELDRIELHLRFLEDLFEREEPVGRRLEFLAQELLREFHTLGAKLPRADVIHRTIEARNVCEQIREQAANVE
jgi:uncharacterized protein (TIGR00255 family)